MRAGIRWLLLFVSVFALVAPSVSAAEGGDELVIGLSDQPDNLNPIFGDIYGTIYGDHWPVFSSLLDYDKNLELMPDLAAALPEISADGLTVTVPLRDDVRFHDGEPLTARDVVFTYESILNPDVATRLRELLLDSLDKVEAVDDHTVRFTLERMDPAILDRMTLGIVPAHLLEGIDLNTAPFNLTPVGSGPFVFEELRPGERMVLRANDDYYGGDVGIGRLVFTFLPDENARAAMLAAGQIDVDAVGLPPRLAGRFHDQSGMHVVEVPGELHMLLLPHHNPILAEDAVRHAIALAVDRKAVAQGVFAGAAAPVFGPIKPGHWAYDPSVEVPTDPDEAKALLDAAGWVPGPDGIRERDGEKLAFPLVYGAGSSVSNEMALAARAALRDVGIDVQLEGLSFSGQTDRLAEGAALVNSQGNAYDPELDFRRLYHSDFLGDDDAFSDPTSIDDPAIDDALDRSRASLDRDERAAAYADFQKALAADASWVYLVQGNNEFVVSDRVQGLDPQVRDGHVHGFSRGLLWNLWHWTLASG